MLRLDETDVPLYRWDGPPRVVAAFSTRLGGVSDGPFASLNLGVRSGDDVPRVLENRRRLCAAVGADPLRTVCLHQVHSATVHDADALPETSFLEPRSSPRGDVLVTRRPGRAVVAFAADCVPVAVASDDGAALAVCHAGWRGLLAGAVEAAVAALPAGPKRAAIGPCAGPASYAVGPEVAEPLGDRFGTDVVRDGRADLPRCAERALRAAGVDDVDVAGICTIDDARFFSHRRDGSPGGRQALIAYLEEAAP
jgi:YfiH family protein